MQARNRRWVMVLLLAAAGAAGIWLARRAGGPAEAPVPVVEDTRPQLTSTRVVGRHQGDRQFELEAGAIADEGDWIRLDAIEHGVLYREGETYVTFTAREGRWHRPSNDLVLTGDVVLVYEGRIRVFSDRLEWRAENELVVSPGPVVLETEDDVVRAAAMEADLGQEVVRLQGDVRIERAGGGYIMMPEVLYYLEEERLEGYGPGQALLLPGGPAGGGPADGDPAAGR
ncbi:MAG TPA: LPS export ABC transporter periplasmic protein LptC [Limnochordales bacterium]|nr:LPS export ABC transporter periplasmic protein LptC [Limnochordales bacterium]